LAFTQVHAAITWEGQYDEFSYSVGAPENGTFYRVDPYCFLDDISKVGEQSSDNGNPYSNSVTKINRVPANDDIITFEAGSNGPSDGMSPENGLMVQGYATIDFNNFDHSNHGLHAENQGVVSYITRRFTVDETGYYDFDASLMGPISYSGSFNHSGVDGPYYAEYSFGGNASINAFKIDDGGNLIPAGEVGSFAWTDEIGEDSAVIQLDPTLDNYDLLYQLAVVLNIDADLSNVTMESITSRPDGAPVFADSEFGRANDPLMVSASVTPVPIPGSLVLLFSGMGSMVVIRRRFCRRS
jgi:hypothetical protein